MKKKSIHKFLNKNQSFLKFIYGMIILNVLCIILESYKTIKNDYSSILYYLEVFSVIIFSIEYVLRLWTAKYSFPTNSNFKSRLRFIFSKYGFIDLVAILPFYLPLIFPFDLRVIRILRLFRLLRIFKLGRFSKSMKTISAVLRDTKSELAITLFVAFVLLILSATLMFYFENEVQPEKFKNIGQSLWWAVATLTTVGYGDVYPITRGGKFLSAIIALIGIGFVALPTGIISSSFVSKLQKEKKHKCPHCGKKH